MSVAEAVAEPRSSYRLCPGIRTSAMPVGTVGSAELLAEAVVFVMVNFGDVLPESPKTVNTT